MKFENLSDWIMMDDGYCAVRIKAYGDIGNEADHVALIEKTPRVRIARNRFGLEREDGCGCGMSETDGWLYGPKGNKEYGENENSRKWCDEMLVLLGWY